MFFAKRLSVCGQCYGKGVSSAQVEALAELAADTLVMVLKTSRRATGTPFPRFSPQGRIRVPAKETTRCRLAVQISELPVRIHSAPPMSLKLSILFLDMY
jgi:hypothetical protein